MTLTLARPFRRTMSSAALAAVAITVSVVLTASPDATRDLAGAPSPAPVAPFWPTLLASSRDLGPSTLSSVPVLVNLRSSSRPAALLTWARSHDVAVGWRSGQRWATVSGTPSAMSRAFDVAVHDYRTETGLRFFGAAAQPRVPTAVSGDVLSVGRIGRIPTRGSHPKLAPPGGLLPAQALRAYDADSLAQAGYDGSGQTVVFFETATFKQSDMDAFATATGLPPISVQKIGDFPYDGPGGQGETTLDIQAVHAIAPAARLVIIDASPSYDSGPAGIAKLFSDTDQQFPGAIWSISIGWGCDKDFTAADLTAVDQALATALSHGSTAYDASGDVDGLECKVYRDDAYSSPPSEDDVGLDAIASLPSMTSVGGTVLSTTREGEWVSEEAWIANAVTQGSSGGVSTVIPRPTYQEGLAGLPAGSEGFRVVPDIAADADPVSGLKTITDGEEGRGGGTSQAAPIWAALTAVMNQYLTSNGGKAIGAINPIIYRLAAGNPAYPPLHDVTLGGNAVGYAAAGYDLVTGWGTPQTWNLVRDVLALQKGQA